MKETVTLQHIADKAGVTRATASMAMRNSAKVALATRERIHLVAEALGYRRNPMVSSLMTYVRTQKRPGYRSTVGFLTAYWEKDVWRGWPTYPEYFGGAVARGAELGYRVEHFWLGDYQRDPSRLIRVMQARGITGVIVPPLPHGDYVLPVELSGFSAVATGYTLASPALPRVCNNHIQTIEHACQRLIGLGYRRVGVAIHPNDVKRVKLLWMAGVAVAKVSFPELDLQVFEPQEWTEEAFRSWFKRTKPEAIVSVTLQMWEWTQRLELKIPAEVGFLHLDCLPNGEISGMYQHSRRIGEAAMDMLASFVESNVQAEKEESRILLISSGLNVGKTLRGMC